MPKAFHSYARSRPEARQQILERLAAGARLSHICREAGMPCAESVTGWMRKDAGFAAEVAQARARGDYRRRFDCDEGRARAVLARLAAGERLADVTSDPAMPSAATVRYWRATNLWFGEEAGRLMGVKAEARAERLRARLRPFDPAVGEKIYVRLWMGGETLREILRSDRAFPSRAVLARWRREEPAFDRMLRFVIGAWRQKRARERGLCTPALTEAVLEGLAQGESLRSLSRRPGMPSQGAMYGWVRTKPEFAAAVAWACDMRADWYREEIEAVAWQADAIGVAAAKRAIGRLSAQETRLRKRPGWKRRRDGVAGRGGGLKRHPDPGLRQDREDDWS